MTLPHPEAILFDLDDTLLAWSETLPIAWTSACNRLAETIEGLDAQMLDAIISFNRKVAPDCSDDELITSALVRMGISDPPDATSVLAKFGQDRLEASRPLNGASDAVRKLRKRVKKLGVVTNGDSGFQREKLRRLGLIDLFDVILTSSEVGIEKGDERIYRCALQRLDVEPTHVWMVGDSLDQDVAVPQELGMKGVWVVWPAAKFREIFLDEEYLPQNSEVIPDLIVKRLPDLLGYL